MCNMVLVSGYGKRRDCRSPTCACPSQYVHHTGERIRDYEEKYLDSHSYRTSPLILAIAAELQSDALREQDNNGDASQ